MGMDEKLDAIFSRWASAAYDHFVSSVAADRKREVDYIRSIAGGRIWVAPTALELGLIDELGDLETVVAAAATAADISEYRVNYVVEEPSPVHRILQQFSGQLGISASPVFQQFNTKLTALMGILGDLSEPRATVLCTQCQVELR